MKRERNKRRRLKLIICYDGTDFVGWQRQKNGRTVQETLQQAFHQLLGQRVQIIGAGRTDSGVHAVGQGAHVDIRSRMPIRTIHRALNALLPADIVVRSVKGVPAGFHARYSVRSKWYRYSIWNHPIRPLLERHGVLHIPMPLRVSAMQRASRLLQGRHDFRALRSTGGSASTTVRTLRTLRVQREGALLWIDAKADGFLYHMVRRIVGLLMEVGRGKVAPKEIPLLLKGKSHCVPPTAPAKGLCLMEVKYG